jgi:four helix bundle protein
VACGTAGALQVRVTIARTHKELICWQRAYEVKLGVYQLLRTGTAAKDFEFRKQLRESASSAPRLMAEGFGRYYPAEFARYLRLANGELRETIESLDDGVDRPHFTGDQIMPLQRLAKRSSRASSRLAAYLDTAEAPFGPPAPRRRLRRR